MGDINLLNAIRSPIACKRIKDFIEEAHKVLNAKSIDELDDIVWSTRYSNYIDESTYDRMEDDINILKDRLIVNYYAHLIHSYYMEDARVTGPKSDRLRQMFNAITNEPQDAYDLADHHYIAYSTLKNHKRYDPYPERGLTKIKNGMIFRLPIEDNENGS